MSKEIEDPDRLTVQSLIGIDTKPNEIVAAEMAQAAMAWTITGPGRGVKCLFRTLQEWIGESPA
jgi:hypothetical protein